MRSFVLSRQALVAIAALGGAACSRFTNADEQPNSYAALNITAKNTGLASATGSATMIFFKGINVQVPSSAQQQVDQCILSAVDTTTDSAIGESNLTTAPALSVGTRSVGLAYNRTFERYESAPSSPFTYTSGESATITVPGSSVFPGSTLSVKLAEPMIPDGVTLPTTGAEWVIRWNGNNDGVSSVQLQLRYANPATSTFANEQIYCVLKDDGSTTLPANVLTAFLASPNALRSLKLLRWRTNEQVIDNRTLLHLASTIDTVITFR